MASGAHTAPQTTGLFPLDARGLPLLFLTFSLEIISNLQISCQSSTENSHILFRLINFKPFLHLRFFVSTCLCLYRYTPTHIHARTHTRTHTHTYALYFSEPFESSCYLMPPPPKLKDELPKNNDRHSAVIICRKLNIYIILATVVIPFLLLSLSFRLQLRQLSQ